MDDLLVAYGKDVLSLKRGDKVKGTITSITPKRVTLDIGGKSEGIVAEKAYAEAKDFIRTLEVGDEVWAGVIIPETYDGITILSFRHAAQDASWTALEKAKAKDTAVIVIGRSVNKSGVMVDAEGLTGFIPISHVGKEASKSVGSLVNKHFKVKVIELDRKENKIVLSEKNVSDAEDIKDAKVALEKIKEGNVYKGEVTTIANFGCFVKIDVKVTPKKKVPLEGLVHISELSWGKVKSARDAVKEGANVDVKVIGKERDRLALSIKKALKDPWSEVSKKYKKDAKVKGEIVKQSDYGIFVKLEDGVEGLIHMTKIPPGKKLEVGQPVNVYVEEVDEKNRKISLGLVLTAKPVGYR